MRDCLLLVGVLMVLILGLPARAAGGCAPLTPTESFLESLARHTPASRPLTDSEVLDLVKKGEITLQPLQVSPPSGPAPLTVEIQWFTYSIDNPVHVEFDFNGDRVFQAPEPQSNPQHGKTTHTYQHEGDFQLTMRVRNREGQVSTYAARVTVMSVAAFDSELRAIWDEMKRALRARDVSSALECIHSSSRARYQTTRGAVLRTAEPIDWVLTDIQFVQSRESSAEYQMLRADDRGRLSYLVRFAVDVDGRWRLRSF